MKKKILSLTLILFLFLAGAAVLILQKTARPAYLSWSVSLEAPVEGGVVKNVQPSLSVPTRSPKSERTIFSWTVTTTRS